MSEIEIETKVKSYQNAGYKVTTITLENGKICLVKEPGMSELHIKQAGMIRLIAGDSHALKQAGVEILSKIWLWGEFDLKTNGQINESEEVLEASLVVIELVHSKATTVKKN